MSDAGALASLKWVETGNRLRSFVRQSRFKLGVIGVFSVIFWICLYRLFYTGLKFVEGIALGSTLQELMAAMFYIFFFALTIMLIFSNAIIGYTSYFKSGETGFLLASPARPEMVFLYKFSESLVFSSWAFLFLGTPLMTAYGHLIGATWDFYVGSAVFLAAFMFIPAAVGSMVAMVITVYAPRTRKGLVVGGALAGMIVLMIIVVKLLTIRVNHGVELELAREVFQSIEFSRFPFLPSYWVTKGILTLGEGQYSPAGFFLAVIAANGLFLMSLTYVMSGHMMLRGWHISQGLRSGKRYLGSGLIDSLFHGILFFTDRNVRLIVVKDVKSFIRDPVQWSQFLIFFGLLAIYFLNLRAFAYDEKDIFWKNLIAQMNLLATSLTLATFASRFIFPQLSLEGRRFWVIGMAPMTREKILFGKLALSFTCSLLISEALITLSSVMLGTPPALAILHAVSLFGICLGLSGLAVGLGAIYPNFSEDNPSKIVSGFGGTLNLVMSLIFVLLVLSAQAVPCFLYYGRWVITVDRFRLIIVGSMAVIAVLSLAACLVPMSLGLKSLKRLEI